MVWFSAGAEGWEWKCREGRRFKGGTQRICMWTSVGGGVVKTDFGNRLVD